MSGRDQTREAPRIGPYVLVRELARGAMGVVYEALAPGGGRVALKVLANVTSKDALARFDRERRLLAELSGARGFVPLLDAGEQAGRPFLVMPLMAGGSLRDRLRRGPLGVEASIELARQLGAAIGGAHARGIVHRDLKPENILFEREGDAAPRIADLGVARHFGEGLDGARSANLSRSGAALGTACYMAPEQVNDARTVGPPADVFALAQLLYECLTGATPFARESLQESLVALVDGRYPPLRQRRPDAPGWLEAVLARALAADPERRLADGQAFARALAQGPFAATARRTRRGTAAMAAGAVVLVGLGAAAVAVARRHPAPAAIAPVVTAPPAPTSPPVERPPVEPAPVATPAVAEVDVPEPGPGAPDSAWIRRGVALANAGLLDRATEAYRRAIALNRRRSTRVVLTFNLIRAGRLDEALVEADALLLESVDPAGLNARGTALTELRQLRGRVDLERSVAKLPGQADTWATLSVARARGRDWTGAREAAERSLAKDTGPGVALRSRGLARVALGDTVGGRADLEAFRAWLTPQVAADDAELQGGLARVGAPTDPARDLRAQATRYVEEAWLVQAQAPGGPANRRDLVERALGLWPAHAGALAMHGAALQGDEGLALLDRAIALGPAEGWMHVERAKHRLAKRDHAGAADDYERALALDGPVYDLLRVRANALHLARDPRAIEAAREVTRARPGEPAGWILLSQAHRGRGDVAAALAAAVKATELATDYPEAWRELGQVQLQRSGWAEALAAFDRLLALAPDDVGGHAGRGVALLSSGQPREGLTHLERAARDRPDSEQLWLALASCRARTGDAPGAAGAAAHVLQLKPGDPEALHIRALALGDVGDRDGARADLAELRRLALGLFAEDPKLQALEQRLQR